MTAPPVPHKRGDTFAWAGLLKITDGAGAHITAAPITGRAQVRTRAGLLIDELAVTIGAHIAGQGFPVTVYKQTTPHWPIAKLEFDIEFTFDNGAVRSTESIAFDCRRDITYGATP